MSAWRPSATILSAQRAIHPVDSSLCIGGWLVVELAYSSTKQGLLSEDA